MRAEINFNEVAELERKMSRIPEFTEEIINNVLDNQAVRIAVEEITGLIRTGERDGKHAKSNKWEKVDKFNLGFKIKTKGGAAKRKGSFGYLVFPNEGRGPRNPLEQRFAERGIEKATPKILRQLNIEIEKKIREVL